MTLITKNIHAEKIKGNLGIDSVSATTISGGTFYGDGSNLIGVNFTGGTITGGTTILSGLTASTLLVTGNTILNTLSANTISATTYFNLPVSGLTQGSNINISGSNGNYTISFTGGNVNYSTNFTNGLTGNTISGGTFYGNGSGLTDIPISGITNLQSSLNNKFDKSGGTINGDVTVNGNVTILGTATTINTDTLLVKDNIIGVNSNYTGNTAPFFGNSGFEVLRGSATTATLLWEEQLGYWTAGLTGSTKRIIVSGDSLSLLNSGHTHPISEIINLQTSLDNKFDKSGGTISGDTIFTNNITASTISATTYFNLPVSALTAGNNIGITNNNNNYTISFTGGTFTATTLSARTIQFDTSYTGTPNTAELAWNQNFGTLQVTMTGGTIQKIGESVYAYVHNAEATTLNRGEVVYIYSSNGDKMSVKRAVNTGDTTSSKTLGLVADTTIAPGGLGYIITQGTLDKLNLGAYTPGDIVWLSSIPGQFTVTKQYAPYHLVFIGVVQRANNGNGQLYVKPQNGYELEELHNVVATGSSYGDLIVYSASNGNNLWVHSKVLTGDYTINGGITITGRTILDGTTASTLNVTGTTILDGTTANTISSTTITSGTFYGSGLGLINIPISGVTNLQTSLDGKLDKSGGTISGDTIFTSGITASTLSVTGDTILNNLTATTISAETYLNTPYIVSGSNGSSSFIIKDGNNTLSGFYSYILGQNSTITNSNYSLLSGNQNLISSSEFSFIFGGLNTIQSNSEYSFIQGYFNTINSNSNNSVIFGTSIELTGIYSFVQGYNSYLSGDYSAIFGQGISGYSDNTVYLPWLNLNYTPTNDNTLTKLLVRDTTDGTVKTRDLSTYYSITGITAQTLTMVDNSNNPVFQVIANTGTSLVQINDLSGLPAFEVFTNGSIKFGAQPNVLTSYQSLYTTTGVTADTGTTIIYSLPTTAYTGAFFDYTLLSGTSNLRAGSVVSVWNSGGTSIEYTETSTNDIGTTTAVTFNMSATSTNVYFQASAVTSGWTIKSMVRTI